MFFCFLLRRFSSQALPPVGAHYSHMLALDESLMTESYPWAAYPLGPASTPFILIVGTHAWLKAAVAAVGGRGLLACSVHGKMETMQCMSWWWPLL